MKLPLSIRGLGEVVLILAHFNPFCHVLLNLGIAVVVPSRRQFGTIVSSVRHSINDDYWKCWDWRNLPYRDTFDPENTLRVAVDAAVFLSCTTDRKDRMNR